MELKEFECFSPTSKLFTNQANNGNTQENAASSEAWCCWMEPKDFERFSPTSNSFTNQANNGNAQENAASSEAWRWMECR